jgi:hypothetical protein
MRHSFLPVFQEDTAYPCCCQDCFLRADQLLLPPKFPEPPEEPLTETVSPGKVVVLDVPSE